MVGKHIGDSSHPDQSLDHRAGIFAGQNPLCRNCGLLGLQDCPEAIFDRRLGDIFAARTAGQVLGGASIGSIEYAVEHLGVPLVVVLGHDSCGAVSAAVQGGGVPGHLKSLVLNSSIESNVMNIAGQLESTQPILSEKVPSAEVMIVGARYIWIQVMW